MKNIGDRINEFENKLTQNVRSFNMIFTEVPIKGFKDTDEVKVCEITKSTCIRKLQVAEFDLEHDFQRKLASENEEEKTQEQIEWEKLCISPV